MASLSLLDILALAVLLVSVVTALVKGLAAEVISLGSAVAGVFLAAFYYEQSAAVFWKLGARSPWAEFFGFVSLFVLAVLAGFLLLRFADKALKALRLKWIDRLLGGAFGFLRGWLVNVALFLALTAFPVSESLVAESRTAPAFLSTANLLAKAVPRELRQKFEDGYGNVYKRWIETSHQDDGTPPQQDDH